MHISVTHVSWRWSLIWCRCKAARSVIKEINSQRIHPVEKHIHPHIEFEVVNQIRWIDIMLRDQSVPIAHIFPGIRQVYAAALTVSLRLHNEHFG